MNAPYLMDDLSSELEQIASAFELGEIKGVITGVVGTFCHVVGLRTSKSRFIVRVLYPETTIERLTAVHTVLARLRQDGFLVPELIRTATGATYLQVDGRLLEVQRFIPHTQQPEHNLLQLRAFFAYLGRLHKALSGYVLARLPPPPAYIYRPILGSLSVIDEAEMRLAAMPAFAERTRLTWIYGRIRYLLKCLRGLQDSSDVDLPGIVIHGDYRLGNIFFQRNSIAAVIDFDMLGWGERLFELAYALYSVDDAIRDKLRHDLYSGQLEILSGLLRQYMMVFESSVDAQEMNALPTMLARVWLNMIALKGAYSSNPVKNVLAMADDIDWCQWLLEHRSEISQRMEERLLSDA